MTWDTALLKNRKVVVAYIQNGRLQAAYGIVHDANDVMLELAPYWKNGRRETGMTIPLPNPELDQHDFLVFLQTVPGS